MTALVLVPQAAAERAFENVLKASKNGLNRSIAWK
jgi:hypothetical protein